MPHLDREALLELREFLTIAVECYRWLLSAIDQTTVDMLGFYFEWRTHRISLRPGLIGSALRRYYVGMDFRFDLLVFVRDHPVAKEPMIASLLAVEEAMVQNAGDPAIGSTNSWRTAATVERCAIKHQVH